jgi:hypothetical protein
VPPPLIVQCTWHVGTLSGQGASDCTPCGDGHNATAGSSRCSACPAGTFYFPQEHSRSCGCLTCTVLLSQGDLPSGWPLNAVRVRQVTVSGRWTVVKLFWWCRCVLVGSYSLAAAARCSVCTKGKIDNSTNHDKGKSSGFLFRRDVFSEVMFVECALCTPGSIAPSTVSCRAAQVENLDMMLVLQMPGRHELPTVSVGLVLVCIWLHCMHQMLVHRGFQRRRGHAVQEMPTCLQRCRWYLRVRQRSAHFAFFSYFVWLKLSLRAEFYSAPSHGPLVCLRCPPGAVTCVNGRVINPDDSW